MNGNKTPKVKNMMYTQQVSHLPSGIQTPEDLEALIAKRLRPKRYALIVHDQDTDDKGQPVEAHVHAMLSFENARYLSAVAKKLGDQPQYLARWDGDANNGYAYLVHLTDTARRAGKYRYDLCAVLANFDFPDLMAQIGAEIVQAKAERQANIKTLLDSLYVGAITKSEIESQLSGSMYARYHRQIDDVHAKRLINEAEKWRKEMREKKAQIRVIWIFGRAGTGKTSLAKEYAEKAGQPYFVSGSTRDIFQGYNGEHSIILDELRPRVIEYCDLLRITDPYGIENQVMAPARYNDKALACDLIVITSPYNPYQFYENSKVDKEDNFDQLERRIALTVRMDSNNIDALAWNGTSYAYIQGAHRQNPYSQAARPASSTAPVDLFNAMFD